MILAHNFDGFRKKGKYGKREGYLFCFLLCKLNLAPYSIQLVEIDAECSTAPATTESYAASRIRR